MIVDVVALFIRSYEEKRKEKPGVRIACPRSSMRLSEAGQQMVDGKQTLIDNAAMLSLELCDGFEWVYNNIDLMLRTTAMEMDLKSNWLRGPAVRMARCRDRVEAGILAELLENIDKSRLDALAAHYKATFIDELKVYDFATSAVQGVPGGGGDQ